MYQSNALRKLEATLDEAVVNGDKNQICGLILLKVMKLSEEPNNIVIFYEILSKAKEEAINLKNLPRLDRYIKTLEELQQVFIVNHVWAVKWSTFAVHIETKHVLNSLDALANYFHSQNSTIFLESEFLEKLNSEFQSLLSQVSSSDLSKALKSFLIKWIDHILQAIQRYDIDGTQGLEKATKSFVIDLVRAEAILKDEDRKNSKYGQVKAWALALLFYFTPTPCDIIGAVPDLHDFWVPKFEELATHSKKIESICETSTIQEVLKSSEFSRQPQKSLPEREIKLLPASNSVQ